MQTLLALGLITLCSFFVTFLLNLVEDPTKYANILDDDFVDTIELDKPTQKDGKPDLHKPSKNTRHEL